MHELSFPRVIGASSIGDPKQPGSRVTGAPSQKYPILRDLAAANARITLEVDTDDNRYVGVIKGIDEGSSAFKPSLLLYLEGRRPAKPVYLDGILAFRVLKIEVEELPEPGDLL